MGSVHVVCDSNYLWNTREKLNCLRKIHFLYQHGKHATQFVSLDHFGLYNWTTKLVWCLFRWGWRVWWQWWWATRWTWRTREKFLSRLPPKLVTSLQLHHKQLKNYNNFNTSRYNNKSLWGPHYACYNIRYKGTSCTSSMMVVCRAWGPRFNPTSALFLLFSFEHLLHLTLRVLWTLGNYCCIVCQVNNQSYVYITDFWQLASRNGFEYIETSAVSGKNVHTVSYVIIKSADTVGPG